MKAKLFAVLLVSFIAAPAFAQIPYANPAAAGIEVLIAERVMFDNDQVNQGNWEPYTSAFGDGTLCLAANTEGQESETDTTPAYDTERVTVAFFNTDGTVQEFPGFYYSVSPAKAWVTNNDADRRNGNPPRIAADKRDGSTKYMVGNECTPWAFTDLFPTFGSGYTYNQTVACCQLLNKTASGPVPLAAVIDPIYGNITTGEQMDDHRYGGEIRALSNGNFFTMVEDRSMGFSSANRASMGAIISGDTGQVITGPFNCNQFEPENGTDCWSGVAAFNGGFVAKPELSADTNYSMFFFNNAGVYQGAWERILRTDPASELAPANDTTTSISDEGRGDGFRIDSDIRNNYVYLAGRGIDATGTNSMGVYITKIDANTRQTVKEVCVNEGCRTEFGGPDRVNVCVDEDGNVFVCWNDKSNTGDLAAAQMAGRFYDGDLNPLSPPFLCFTSCRADSSNTDIVTDFSCPSCAMINGRCLVAGRVNNPPPDGSFEDEDQIAIVLKIPVASAVGNWTQY